MHDSPDSQATRDALVESEAKFRAILNAAVDGIISIDERGIIESFNRAAERLFGFNADEVVGNNVSMLMPEPDRSQHDEYIRTYLGGAPAKIIGIGREVLGQRKDGSTFPMDLAVSEVRFQDRRVFTGIVRDLTERKRMERQILEISDREQRRIGQDLHDGLGQVLAGIGFMISALHQRLMASGVPEADDVRQIAELVTQATAQTRGLARGLHPVRAIESGLMTALEELANSVEQVYRITCEFRCDEPIAMYDSAAATHIYRIAQEAVANAVKHGKASRIVIALARNDGQATLAVIDNGIGIKPEELVPAARKGMGLNIMRYRAALVGATVSVRPGTAGGTVVTCTWRIQAYAPQT